MRVAGLVFLLAFSAIAQDLDALKEQLQDDVALKRFEAARAIGALGADGRGALRALIDLLGDEESWVKLEAGRSIVRVGITKRQVKGLVERLELVPPDVAQLLAEALAAQPASLDALVAALDKDNSKRLRREAVIALSIMGPKGARALPHLLDLTQDKNAALQKVARDGVRRLAPWSGACVEAVAERLTAEHAEIRWIAARLLTSAGPAARAAIPALKQAAAGGDARLASAARTALTAIDVASAASATEALLKPQAALLRAPDKFRVVLQTSKGKVVIEVQRDWAPRGADRFYNLVKLGFFDGARFFRVLPGFVAQFGLNGNAKVNAAWRSATIEDDPVKESNTMGMVCFATAGPNTRTTQLFISLGNNKRLDATGFAPFGKVVYGMDAVKKLHAGYRDRPDQQLIQLEGNAYLQREFPNLDYIEHAVLEER
ncbi:MAG: peptidylprolyl isomerase [Planctomycetota bacterium]|jgi:peptidyl-prolyl cis-trans isomerase A (cyclophilin A)